MDTKKLKVKALNVRKDVLDMVFKAKDGHIPSSLSLVEILVVLYYEVLNIDPKHPKKEGRDRFILSKGHGCASLYSVLADLGFFNKDELSNFTQKGSILGGHPDHRLVPGIEISTGSLAQGISMAVGFAMSAKLSGSKHKIYCLAGDGECNEGSVWEAAQVASHYKLDNLILIIDHNKHQSSGRVEEVLHPYSIKDKFGAFGWSTVEVDGHNIPALRKALSAKNPKNMPCAVIAHTIKGKGVSFMEDKTMWHTMIPSEEEYKTALKELKGVKAKLLKK